MPYYIIRDDIARVRCDAIVNSTNREMIAMGGADLAIRKAAGERLDADCRQIAPLCKGGIAVTPGYALPARYIIHTIAPVLSSANEESAEAELERCYTACLEKADELGVITVAFPLIGSGEGNFTPDKALEIATRAISAYLNNSELIVMLTLFDRVSFREAKKIFGRIAEYIDENYAEEFLFARGRNDFARDVEACCLADMCSCSDGGIEDISSYLKRMDKGFAETLFEFIDERGISDVECYKRANVDKKTFSKIKCNRSYRPSKTTALSFAVSLRLDLDETARLLNTVGMSLSKSSKFDLIVEYFILNKKYDIFEINEALYAFDQPLLGSL